MTLSNCFAGARSRAQNARHGEIRESVMDFLRSLPKLESHYCRSNNSKLFLEPVFDSLSALYNEYKRQTSSDKYASIKLFRQIFESMNIGIYKPKKDQCDTCVGFEVGNVTEEEYNIHQHRKQQARAEKERDKDLGNLSERSTRVITVDLQAVLLSPKLNASALYYKTKLACHNYTIFDLNSKDVTCYFWHEGQGDLSGNSFASCMAHYIESIVSSDVNHVIVYSDGCGYQNRNSILANTLCHLSRKLNVTITQKFLEKGHTQMEVDSVHSVVERKIKRKNIYVPQNYVEILQEVRPAHPFVVHYIDHSFSGAIQT